MALSNSERQKKSREKAALNGSKSLSLGMIPTRYHARFKELAMLAKEGTLDDKISELTVVNSALENQLNGAAKLLKMQLKEAAKSINDLKKDINDLKIEHEKNISDVSQKFKVEIKKVTNEKVDFAYKLTKFKHIWGYFYYQK